MSTLLLLVLGILRLLLIDHNGQTQVHQVVTKFPKAGRTSLSQRHQLPLLLLQPLYPHDIVW